MPTAQELTAELALRIRTAGAGVLPTTAADHRALETLIIEAIEDLQASGPGGAPTFPANEPAITASLPGGRNLGTLDHGQTLVLASRPVAAVLRQLAVGSIYPTYTPASVSINVDTALTGEVGTSLSVSVTGNFIQGNAGAVTAMRVYKGGGAQIGAGGSGPTIVRGTTIVLGTVPVPVWVVADYAAGLLGTVQPAGTPDDRAPQVRNPNAPQAAEVGLSSSIVYFQGHYLAFFGPSNGAPGSSAAVRTLAGNSAGNTFTLQTGTTERHFAIWVPPGKTLSSVLHQELLNTPILDQFTASAMSVQDAGGNSVAGTLWVKTQAVPYASNQNFIITLS